PSGVCGFTRGDRGGGILVYSTSLLFLRDSMKRVVVLAVLIIAGALSLLFAAQQQAQAPKVIEVTKLKDNLFVLKGGGGNTAVFVMAGGGTAGGAAKPRGGGPNPSTMK